VEYLDILDDKGNKTGKIASREEAHKLGLWHKAVHIWFINSQNEILLQLRSMKKESSPGKWDISVAGHVPAGEDDISGAIRETEEEIGLSLRPEDFEFIGNVKQESTRPEINFINKEINPVFIVRKDLDISKLKIQKEEVDELKYILFKEFKEMVERRDPSLVLHTSEFELLFTYLMN
jgi:isopentenyldiphosphate isomerase